MNKLFFGTSPYNHTEQYILSYVYEYDDTLSHYVLEIPNGEEKEYNPYTSFISVIEDITSNAQYEDYYIIIKDSVPLEDKVKEELYDNFLSFSDEEIQTLFHMNPNMLVGSFYCGTINITEETAEILFDVLTERMWNELTLKSKINVILNRNKSIKKLWIEQN